MPKEKIKADDAIIIGGVMVEATTGKSFIEVADMMTMIKAHRQMWVDSFAECFEDETPSDAAVQSYTSGLMLLDRVRGTLEGIQRHGKETSRRYKAGEDIHEGPICIDADDGTQVEIDFTDVPEEAIN
jgi:hypothetical protein